MRRFLFLIFICCSVSIKLTAQQIQKPDYKSIEKNIENKKSNLYYDKLYKRYLKGDTTLSFDERQHLYYGFQFQKSYSPYVSSDFQSQLNKVFKKEKLETEDYRKAIALCDSILTEDPFSIRHLNMQARISEKLEEEEKALLYYQKMKIVLSAIFSSGDGLTDKTAMYVIVVSHEYDILNIYGLKFTSQSLIGDNDYMSVAENEDQIKGMYFDVSASMNSLDKLFK